MRHIPSVLLLAMLTFACGQSYTFDAAGGPLTLGDELAAAAAAWEAAAEEVELERAADAANEFTFADPALLGPDVVSATLVREGEPGLEVWLHPGLYEEFPQALLHEFGLLLGLPSSDSGVMDPALAADGPDTLGADDLEAFQAARARSGGDIDGDGDVDIYDLAALGRAYGLRGVNLPADLNGDGVVDAEDVRLLRENYTFTDPEAPDAEDDVDQEAVEGEAEL